jgi:hypothetical protein
MRQRIYSLLNLFRLMNADRWWYYVNPELKISILHRWSWQLNVIVVKARLLF